MKWTIRTGLAALAGAGLAMTACTPPPAAPPEEPANEPPVAVVVSPEGMLPSGVLQFRHASTDPDGTVVSCTWTIEPFDVLGDQNWEEDQCEFDRFVPIGTHWLTLTVTDDDGSTASERVFLQTIPGVPGDDDLPD